MLGGDPAVCSHRVEQLPALRCLEGSRWVEIHQFALSGSSSSLHSEACSALGASDEVIQSAAEIQQFARTGLRSSVHSAACNAFGASDEVMQRAGGDPAVCSHGVEKLIALCGL